MGGLTRSVARVAVGQLPALRMGQLRKQPCAYRHRISPLFCLFLFRRVVCFSANTFLHIRLQTHSRLHGLTSCLHIFFDARLVCDHVVTYGQGVSNIAFLLRTYIIHVFSCGFSTMKVMLHVIGTRALLGVKWRHLNILRNHVNHCVCEVVNWHISIVVLSCEQLLALWRSYRMRRSGAFEPREAPTCDFDAALICTHRIRKAQRYCKK